jgi:hypothetical protein
VHAGTQRSPPGPGGRGNLPRCKSVRNAPQLVQKELAPWGSGGSPPRTKTGRSRSALSADRDRPIVQREHSGYQACNGVVPTWPRRPASRYAVPRRHASRGVLRVGAPVFAHGVLSGWRKASLRHVPGRSGVRIYFLRGEGGHFKSTYGCTVTEPARGSRTRRVSVFWQVVAHRYRPRGGAGTTNWANPFP